jgi:hypothetical protein
VLNCFRRRSHCPSPSWTFALSRISNLLIRWKEPGFLGSDSLSFRSKFRVFFQFRFIHFLVLRLVLVSRLVHAFGFLLARLFHVVVVLLLFICHQTPRNFPKYSNNDCDELKIIKIGPETVTFCTFVRSCRIRRPASEFLVKH